MFDVKQCEDDFHRGNAFSKIIGQGPHPQIIEVQCAREYEGKGAYPNYIANGVIEGFEEHLNTMPAGKIRSLREFYQNSELLQGVWTWTRGGGWDGPYIKNELWCDLNALVMAQWANHPTDSQEAIFRRYAVGHLKLKGDDVDRFRELCFLSAKAVLGGERSAKSEITP